MKSLLKCALIASVLSLVLTAKPLPADPVGELRGKYRGRGPSSARARAAARAADLAKECSRT